MILSHETDTKRRERKRKRAAEDREKNVNWPKKERREKKNHMRPVSIFKKKMQGLSLLLHGSRIMNKRHTDNYAGT